MRSSHCGPHGPELWAISSTETGDLGSLVPAASTGRHRPNRSHLREVKPLSLADLNFGCNFSASI
jgi:hypothetical protein